MNKDFALFMSQLQETNQTLDFFCDFDKISSNAAEVEMSLNTLNYLIGKEDLARGVSEIWRRDPGVFEVLGILIAVRDEGKKPVVDATGKVVLLKSYFKSEAKVVDFLNGTGLAEVFSGLFEFIRNHEVALKKVVRLTTFISIEQLFLTFQYPNLC